MGTNRTRKKKKKKNQTNKITEKKWEKKRNFWILCYAIESNERHTPSGFDQRWRQQQHQRQHSGWCHTRCSSCCCCFVMNNFFHSSNWWLFGRCQLPTYWAADSIVSTCMYIWAYFEPRVGTSRTNKINTKYQYYHPHKR